MTTVSATHASVIPASHLDLLTRPVYGVFTTIGADGEPQSSLVWVDFDGDCARINTALERQKGRNLLANPKVSLLIVDPDKTDRYLQIQGDAELITDGALGHLDALTRKYTRHPAYYGCIYPAAQRESETRVTCRIHPRRVTRDAIFSSAETREGDVSVSNQARISRNEADMLEPAARRRPGRRAMGASAAVLLLSLASPVLAVGSERQVSEPTGRHRSSPSTRV